MSVTTGHRIQVGGPFVYEEDVCGAVSILPGHLVEVINNAGVRNLRPHNTAGGRGEAAFAIENANVGLMPGVAGPSFPTSPLATAYTVGQTVYYILPSKGARVNALCKVSNNYTVGLKLISAGDGTLEPYTAVASTDVPGDEIAEVMEPQDLTVSGAVNSLICVRIL